MNDERSVYTDFAIRALLIVLAYALACIVTGFYVSTLLLLNPDGAGQSSGLGLEFLPNSFFISTILSIYAGPLAALVVAASELKAWRMWWYFALAGALIGLMMGSLFAVTWWFPWAGLVFSPVSGSIFWAIAGRKAGGHKASKVLFIILAVVGLVMLTVLYFPMFGRSFVP